MLSLTHLGSPKFFDKNCNPDFTNGNRARLSLPITKTQTDEESPDPLPIFANSNRIDLPRSTNLLDPGKKGRRFSSVELTMSSSLTHNLSLNITVKNKESHKDDNNSGNSNETCGIQYYKLKHSYSSDAITLVNWNRIEIHEPVGRGAYSIVYRGRLREDNSRLSSSSLVDIFDKSLNLNKNLKRIGKPTSIIKKICEKNPSGLDVAVKIFSAYKNFYIPDEALKDDKWKKAFIKEVFIVSKLPPHENLIRIFGVCTKPELCLIMEYCEGGTLFKKLHLSNKQSEITWTLGIRWFKEILTAVHYLHNCFPYIIHRDLKTLNILLSHQSLEKATLKIADFGLSKVSGQLLSQNEINSSSNNITAPYCAPETFLSGGFSFASDVYAIGIIFWEIATRIISGEYELPFSSGLEKEKCEDRKFQEEDLTQIQVIARVIFDNIRPRISNKCPIPLKKLIRRFWASNPSERPVIDTKLLEEIETVLKE